MVRGTFSPARAWRLAVGPASTRTLGCTQTMTVPLPVVRGLRDCGTAQSCQLSAAQEHCGWTRRAGSDDQLGHAQLPRRQRQRVEAAACFRKEQHRALGALRSTPLRQAPTLGKGVHGGHAYARHKAPCTTHGVSRRRGVPRLLFPQRGAVGILPRLQRHALHEGARVQPNPSFKLSPNGGSRWSSSAGPAAHFALAAQHAPPSVPA